MKKMKGFSLLEILVVAAILSLLSIVLTQVFFVFMRTNNKTDIIQGVKSNGDRALDTLTRLIQNAKSIRPVSDSETCPESPGIGHITEVMLVNPNNGETTLTCTEEEGIARIASVSAAGQTVYLTDSNITLVENIGGTNSCSNNALSFRCSSQNGTPILLYISYTLQQKDASAGVNESASASFQTTVTLRNK